MARISDLALALVVVAAHLMVEPGEALKCSEPEIHKTGTYCNPFTRGDQSEPSSECCNAHRELRARVQGCGWGWAGVIWLYILVTYIPLDFLKFAIHYILGGNAWNNLLEKKLVPMMGMKSYWRLQMMLLILLMLAQVHFGGKWSSYFVSFLKLALTI